MKSHPFLSTAIALGVFLSAWETARAQTPPATLRLTSKVRDFREVPDAVLPPRIANTHPDFNTFPSCAGTGYVEPVIDTTGATDPVNFPFDNRNPRLQNVKSGCYTSKERFDQWYNDRDTSINRPFLYDLVFSRNGAGMYEYANSSFFPLDDDSLTRNDPVLPGQKITRPLKNGIASTFGQLNTGSETKLHNFGFTTEFHASFTYVAADASHPAQVFNFSGDDDVWVFINGKLAIDLGGVHAAQSKNITLDAGTAANLGLINGRAYMLDFFLAERHIFASNCRITTSIVLETQKVAKPVADPPGKSFNSQLSVLLTTPTPGATIYYTTNGATPDSTSAKYDPAKPIAITATTTLKAIAYKAEWQKSDVMVEQYTKNYVPSTLDILDQNGNPLPGYLTQLNTAYTIKLTTSQAGLTSVTTNATTKTAGDNENVAIANPSQQAENVVFTGTEPLAIATAAANNGKSEAGTYDSLIVRWVNPQDPTHDIAEKRVYVRPAPKQATAYFSTKADGTGQTDTFTGTETTLYVYVSDEVLRASDKPTITLATTPKANTGRTGETETFDLTAISPGLYRATVPVALLPTPTVGDKTLQLQLEDLIKATYKDPMDGDSAVANAGFGIAPEIDGTLSFTDKDHNVLPNGFYYSPSEGKLYLQYKDDFVLSLAKVTATITIVNRKGTADADQETFSLDLQLAKKVGSTGVWEGELPLKDGPTIRKNNGTAETYVLGEVHASVTSHTKANAAAGPATDDLLVAYANQGADIKITGPGGTVPVKRADASISVTVNDQSLSSVVDTLYYNLTCTGSHDVLQSVQAIETGAATGIYQTVIPKGEGAAAADGKLQCLSHDIIRVTYSDPVYGDTKNYETEINEPVQPVLTFTSDPQGKVPVSAVSDGDVPSFYAVVTAQNANINAVDTVPVTVTVGTGETETFKAVETGLATNTFVVQVPFKFVTGATTSGNQVVEGKIGPDNTSNLVTAIGKVTVDGQEATKTIDLLAAYDKAVKAYVKDTDGDGKADKVYVEFENRLNRVPGTVVARWNSDLLPGHTADKAKISFLNADSNVVVIDYGADEFGLGLTAVDPKSPPTATLPDDALFKAQKPLLEDSIGPIIVSAIKYPVNPNLIGKGDPALNRDTLRVKLSEPLKNADFKEILKFASSCSEYAKARTVTAAEQPTADPTDPTTYIIIVDNNTGIAPEAGNCVFLNADGKYTDNNLNLPPQYGVKLEGNDGRKLIQLFRGYPPVAGLDPNNPAFQVSVQDTRDPNKQGYSEPDSRTPGSYVVNWIPPVGFDPAHPSDFKPYQVGVNSAISTTPEAGTIVSIPPDISIVQVVSKDPYVARITIFDNLGNFVRSMTQSFGYMGELQNDQRIVPKGRVSFLVWDQKDVHGQLAGNGVYVWKVQFQFKGGKQEVQYTRTGILRKK